MNEFDGPFEHSHEGIKVGEAKAYEIMSPTPAGPVTRLGWVVSVESEGVPHHWVALAVLSNTGDSFLGTFKDANGAITALVNNEQELAKERDV